MGKRWVKIILLLITVSTLSLLVWMGMADFYFSSSMPRAVLVGLFVLSLGLFFISLTSDRVVWITLLVIFVPCSILATLLFSLADGDIEETYFRKRKEPVIYMSDGATGRWLLISGTSYLGKWVYHFDYTEWVPVESVPQAYELKDKYELPAALNDSTYVLEWEHERLLLDLDNKVCYPVTPKQAEKY